MQNFVTGELAFLFAVAPVALKDLQVAIIFAEMLEKFGVRLQGEAVT